MLPLFSYSFQGSFDSLCSLRMTGRKSVLGRNDRGRKCSAVRGYLPYITLSSSSLACAVSILPFGKMLDLQGGSSSFPKISLRCDFREPYNEPRSRTGLLR